MKRLLILVCLAAFGMISCNSGTPGGHGPTVEPKASPQGQPRKFAMGVSSLPPELTDASYERTFALAGTTGDMILIQRVPPWDEMISGDLSSDTVRSTKRETELAKKYGLRLFIAIDPTDPALGRAQLASLPDNLRGADFGNENVRKAMINYARYIAENYQPDYLAIGVEINSYQRTHEQDFERFVQLYHEAYRAVKQASPKTLVFPTFQLEELQGLLPPASPQTSQWFLFNRFLPNLDLLAVSTYPSTAYGSFDQLPASYFAQLATYTDRRIAIAGTGYPSLAASTAEPGNSQQQANYLRRVFDNAQQMSMPFVVWFLSQDPTYTNKPPLDRLQSMGLRDQNGGAKPVFDVWQSTSRRPLVPPTPAPVPTALLTAQ